MKVWTKQHAIAIYREIEDLRGRQGAMDRILLEEMEEDLNQRYDEDEIEQIRLEAEAAK